MKYRIFIDYYRPEIGNNTFFAIVDEKIMLDYNIYFFDANDMRRLELKILGIPDNENVHTPISLALAKIEIKYYKLSVYRNGNTQLFINKGEQIHDTSTYRQKRQEELYNS